MANRFFKQFSYSYAVPVDLYLTVSFAAAGAPTKLAGTGMGIKSITRISAGLYDIALQDSYASLLAVQKTIVSSAASTAPEMRVVTSSVGNNIAPVLRVQFSAAGTATDPASGEVVLLDIKLQNSSLPY